MMDLVGGGGFLSRNQDPSGVSGDTIFNYPISFLFVCFFGRKGLGSSMLTVHIPGAFNSCQAHMDMNVLQEAMNSKLMYVSPLIHSCNSTASTKFLYHKGWSSCSYSQSFSNQITSRRWLCRSQDSISPENEYRSSRNIAISLFRRYRNYVERGGGDNLKEFISAGVNAYELGCTDQGLKKELTDMKESGVEIEAMQGYGGNTGLKSKIISQEVDECIMWLSIVFITILCTPQPTIVRWSSSPPVSGEMVIQWKGFCAIIANAYYMRGMAWLPVKTLQLEQMAVTGRAEEPSLVASRMRLVFSTLEVVSPQWPRV
ncbi:orotidine 5'-phosphate decarboxylase [Perilla frutescens var. hirtella]|uniref:Orotidine 5'-phosphate decarboxylase n=1 Tax=Perilla frutescens var. hirtella TaxID=608512 RepID=A0AAD4IYU0_PERFH|nr:orotidine 5'-phosphate decarboxylase [Perilla frutescens var. hirtella]